MQQNFLTVGNSPWLSKSMMELKVIINIRNFILQNQKIDLGLLW